MGSRQVTYRVVVDTNVVVSALVFRAGRVSWLRSAWSSGAVIPVVSESTVTELLRVLAYPKFVLTEADIDELLAEYLPYAEVWATETPPSGIRVSDPDNAVFVAEGEDGGMSGYLIAKIKDQPNVAVRKAYRCLYVDDLCVDPDSRKQGAGQALFEAAKEFARENGCYSIELNVWEFNGGARAFYERMGMSTQKRTMELLLNPD